MIEYRHTWGEERVYFLDPAGQVQRLPAAWTDIGGEDPFVVVAAGRSPFRVTDLLQLAEMIDRLDADQEM